MRNREKSYQKGRKRRRIK